MRVNRRAVGASLVIISAAVFGCAGTGPVSTPFTRGKPDLERIPADLLREAAAEIEQAVYSGNRTVELTDREGLVVNTPEILQAVRTRAARIELVNTFLNAGHAWERPNGRLWIIRSDEYKRSTTYRQRDIDAIMVNSENRDRWTIYESIIDANKFPQGALSAIEQIFFEARRQFMASGQKYEGPEGEPVPVP